MDLLCTAMLRALTRSSTWFKKFPVQQGITICERIESDDLGFSLDGGIKCEHANIGANVVKDISLFDSIADPGNGFRFLC